MLTRCPKCQTIYRLTPTQLEAAGGQVRCSRCMTVFNAQDQLPAAKNQPDIHQTGSPPAAPPLVSNTRETVKELPRQLMQSQSRPNGSASWLLLALLLITSACIQLAWIERRDLVNDPQGKRFLNLLCNFAGCTPPEQRSLHKFQVLSRDMTAHPDKRNALLFLLVMANQANFSQPYPYLQLQLFDDKRQIAGQRTFTPAEYLHKQPTTLLLEPNHAIYIRLELLDPGPNINGFEINFL